ncbi:MAG: hypothetical protein JJE28_03190 [Actinomycetales bacterium]|nr:hypothetical protein [Actinomycetales bacterium]
MLAESINPFRVLFVCTGNICRSPLAEQLLNHHALILGLPLEVSSAGTQAQMGADIPQEVSLVAASLSFQFAAHQPRQLTDEMIHSANLVLTGERSHRAEVASRVPSASRKTFTLNQFGRLATEFGERDDYSKPDNLLELVQEIADFRAIATPLNDPRDDDVIDPYRKPLAVYEASGQHISRCIDSLVFSIQHLA